MFPRNGKYFAYDELEAFLMYPMNASAALDELPGVHAAAREATQMSNWNFVGV